MQDTVGKSRISRLRIFGVDCSQAVIVAGSHQLPDCAGISGRNLTADNGIGRKTNDEVDNFCIGQFIGLCRTGQDK